MSLSRSFAPVAGPETRLLILGSLPGVKSLEAAQYYAHPQNQFWTLIGEVIGIPLKPVPYPDRLAALAAHKVGLWDVIQEATRPGSLDAAIRDHSPNDLRALHAALPNLRAIGFNGGTAAKLGEKLLDGIGLPMIRLPSTSPAYTIPIDTKRAAWLELRRYL